MAVRPLLACLVALSLGCASARPGLHRAGMPVAELLAGTPLGLPAGAVPPVEPHEVLLVSAEMQAFLDRHVNREASAITRLRQLGQAILSEKTFGLKYDESTRTAADTFRVRHGNCLSFSSMFVAMARRVSLAAHYHEVDIPPDWTLRNDVLVLNRHVNVVVELGREGDHVVDFNLEDFRTSYDRRRISDTRALAHHDNNMGVERMQLGDSATAFLYLRRAVQRDPTFSPAWTNLGILYMRLGATAHAEAAYLQALGPGEQDLVAMSNLASLYERTGDQERAARYRRQVSEHRNSNPYYRFQLAQDALLARDYDTAIGHLQYALGRKKNEDRFYFLLGLSHLRKGNQEAARKWFARAEEIAATDVLKRRYASKVGTLLGPPRPE